MKASELIKALKKAIKEHGDFETFPSSEGPLGSMYPIREVYDATRTKTGPRGGKKKFPVLEVSTGVAPL